MTYFRKKKILALSVFFLLVTVPMSFSATVSTWLLDEGQGQVVQDQQARNNGFLGKSSQAESFDPTRANIVPMAYEGNKSLQFSGSGFGTQCVVVPDSDSLDMGSITLEAWFKPAASLPAFTRLLCKGDTIGGTTGSFKLYTKLGATTTIDRLLWEINVGGTLKTIGTPNDFDVFTFTDGEGDWVHIAAVYNKDNGTARIYVNGVQKAGAQLYTSGISLAATDVDLSIGNRVESDRGFVGVIDEVRISDQELAAYQLGYYGTFGPSIFLPAPSFAPVGPYINGPTLVDIACDVDDATIYYTTDGSDPTANSDVYTGPVTVTGGTPLNAMAMADGYGPSAITSVEYIQIDATQTIITTLGDTFGTNGWRMSMPEGIAGGEWVEGPANPPCGTGSFHLTLHDPYKDNAASLACNLLDGKPLSDLTELIYSTYKVTGEAVYIYFNVDTNDDGMMDEKLFFYPGKQSRGVALQEWQSWNARDGLWCWLYHETQLKTFDQVIAENPGAKFSVEVNDSGDPIGAIHFVTGYFGLVDSDTYLDQVFIGIADQTTTMFDFEFQNVIPGDANSDGRVDVGDLGILAANYGGTEKTWAQGDFNSDGRVDVGDLGILAANYGQGVSGSADFNADYAKVFSENVQDDDAEGSFCGVLGLPLIAGCLLAVLTLMTGVRMKD